MAAGAVGGGTYMAVHSPLTQWDENGSVDWSRVAKDVYTGAKWGTLIGGTISVASHGLRAGVRGIQNLRAGKNVAQRAQAMLDGSSGVNFTARADGVNYRLNIAGGKPGAGTLLTDVQAFEDVIGSLSRGNRMVISPQQAVALERSLGLPTGRLSQGGIISIVDDVALRAPRSPLSGNDLFLGGGRGLPGGGPEINVAPINNAGGGGIRQIILNVEKKL